MRRKAPPSLSQALKEARSLLEMDPMEHGDAVHITGLKAQVRVYMDLLAAEHPTEACELGLLLEQSLETVGAPVGAPNEAHGEPGSRFALVARVLGIARAQGHSFYEVEALTRQAELLLALSDRGLAGVRFEDALRVAREAGIGVLEVTVLSSLAALAQGEGNLFKAHGLYLRQLQVANGLGETPLVQQSLGNLSATANAMGDHRRGARYAREHLLLSTQVGDAQGAAEALCNLGVAQRHLGEAAAARRSYQEALAQARRAGSLRMEAAVCYNLGCLLGSPGVDGVGLAADSALALALLDRAGKLALHGGVSPLLASAEAAAARVAAGLSKEALEAARRSAPTLLEPFLA